MVVFSCDGCAEVLKKNQVDTHASRCKRCFSVSCADCLVSFPGDDYRAHTSCMTEVERYETKGRVSKNTKVSPQQQWTDLLASSIDGSPAHLKQHLQTMASLDNVPRKEKQFRNFAKNSLHLHARDSDKLLNEIWKYLVNAKEQQRKEQQPDAQAKNEHANKVDGSERLSQATEEQTRALECSIEKAISSVAAPTSTSPGNITSDLLTPETIKKAMKQVLNKSEGKTLPIKALRKTLRKQLGLSKGSKHQLKNLMKDNLSKKRFILDGKMVRLKAH